MAYLEPPDEESIRMIKKLEQKVRETKAARFQGFISPFKLKNITSFEKPRPDRKYKTKLNINEVCFYLLKFLIVI